MGTATRARISLVGFIGSRRADHLFTPALDVQTASLDHLAGSVVVDHRV